MNPLSPAEPVELQIENRIDSICDAFETAWRAGQRPQIEDYLGETVATGRMTLLLELVRVETYYRRRDGEAPKLQEYLQRFPQDAPHLSAGGLAEALWAPAEPELWTHGSIGTFDLLELLGEGAFGCVWKARDRKLDRIVALKLPRGDALNAAEAASFLREAQAAAQLQHPNIVAVFGVERDDRRAFIVSEYVEGMNLKEWLAQQRPTFEEAARLSVQLAEALAHAHRQGVVHRDLKPANILLDRAGEPHVTDFGLAKRLSAESSILSGQHVLGTPAYMSPEQAAGDSQKVDARSDLYSLGIILYELLTGRRAFEGDQQSILRLVLSAEPKPPRQIRPEIPKGLEAICLKAIAKDREQRYPSVEEFSTDLNRYLRSEPVQARPRSGARSPLWSRRRFAGSALATVPAFGFGYALWSGAWGDRAEIFRPVALQTQPAGAEIWFVPLDEQSGEPDPARIVPAGRSPVTLELPPGDYLVEAVLDEQRFHEVYRHVPGTNESAQEGFAHRFSTLQPGKPIALPTIWIPNASVTTGMAQITGDPRFDLRRLDAGLGIPSARNVPPFFMEPFEFTCGEYKRINAGNLPRRLKAQQYTDLHAVPLNFDLAMTAAERAGKRLPHEAEYEFVATSGGTRTSPWNGALAREDQESPIPFGPVNGDPTDRVDLDPRVAIFGLCSNVAEWAINWGDAFGTERTNHVPRPQLPGDHRIVRGGSPRVIEGDAVVTENTRAPFVRVSRWRSDQKPGLGVRFVRSSRPRLVVKDFVRPIVEITDNRPIGGNPSGTR